jgi:D-alanine-D-alanine ligase
MKVAILVKGAFSQAQEDVKREGQQTKTAQPVAEVLDERGCETSIVSLAPPDFSVVQALDCDVVFNLYAATGEEQALVSSVLQLTGIPYTGCTPLGHYLALNKHHAKTIWRDKGVPTPDWIEGAAPAPDAFPLIVKPARGGSGEGIFPSSVVYDLDGLEKHVASLNPCFRPLLVEQYLPGREFTVAMLGNPPEVLPPLEITFDRLPEGHPPIFSFDAKTRYVDLVDVTLAELSPEADAALRRVALGAFEALELRDCARADIRLDADSQPRIFEVNSLPGLEPGYSLVPEAAEAAGISFSDLIWRMVQMALNRECG